jgi:hypothetical protein
MGVEDFTETNCKLYTPLNIFMGIYQASGGKPCDGCSHASGCQNYYLLHPDQLRKSNSSEKVLSRPNKKRPKNKNRAAF